MTSFTVLYLCRSLQQFSESRQRALKYRTLQSSPERTDTCNICNKRLCDRCKKSTVSSIKGNSNCDSKNQGNYVVCGAAGHLQLALITKINRPSVKIVIGSVKMTKSGRTKVLRIPNTTAATNAPARPSISTPIAISLQ